MEYIRTLTREFEVGDRAELRVENRSGTVTVRGEETGKVRVEVVARLWAESDDEADDQVELIDRRIRQEGRRVLVRAPTLPRPPGLLSIFGRGPRIDYQVTVPRATEARVANRSGRVEVMDVAGPLQAEAKSGQVVVEGIGADTTIGARSGRVQAESIAGSLTIDARSGKVQVRGCEGDATVLSRSGSFQIEDVGGSLRVESRSGALTISNVGGACTVRSRSGVVRYTGAVRGPFDIEVVNGAVVLAVDPDSTFYLDAETTNGSIHQGLPFRGTPAGGAPSPKAGATVRVRTRSGSISIVPR
jgi:DUF4097 and DUF4098 domain-containing protein YvlB